MNMEMIPNCVVKLSNTEVSLLVEARDHGHAEARGVVKAKTAVKLCERGLFVLGGGSTGGFKWYKLTAHGAEVARVLGAS
jgi:hypothetical protein